MMARPTSSKKCRKAQEVQSHTSSIAKEMMPKLIPEIFQIDEERDLNMRAESVSASPQGFEMGGALRIVELLSQPADGCVYNVCSRVEVNSPRMIEEERIAQDLPFVAEKQLK